MPDGTRVVPLDPPHRIQIYTPDWHFVRGWPVDISRGFILRPSGNDRFDVITNFSRTRYTYSLNGELVATMSVDPSTQPTRHLDEHYVAVPTRVLLWPFSTPLISFLLFFLLGCAMIPIIDLTARGRRLFRRPVAARAASR